ncbi:hypothetical protein BWI93_15345 [Siphonobacter sp. BAB-5385]|uniref:hypothetical protein n=1 Tax=Siphonobacter sp. BAB-5385 TaxID=1864822 RepID=UPI000B9EE12C|nr:hypothetical protein [Siphonobacter sp. BAB-5385]OZI07387.1 hypothetical protein BWI93_15345 [Siphonobacter sp. BAB-5385]
MKILLGGMIIGLSLWSMSCVSSSDTNITVSDNEKAYTFSAHYDQSRTAALQAYMADAFGEKEWGSQDDIDQITTLADQTTFHIEASAGQLAIELDKSANKPAAYQRMKQVCEGMRKVILNP